MQSVLKVVQNFYPKASEPETISELVREINGPLCVVMGLTGNDMTVSHLQDLGVRRISIGGSLARALYYRMRTAAGEMFQRGTFSYAKDQISQADLNKVFEKEL